MLPESYKKPGLRVGGSGYSCEVNDWKQLQYCRCLPGQRITKFVSFHQNTDYHANSREDRKWTLECGDIEPKDNATDSKWTYDTSDQNDWDRAFEWNGIYRNAFMVGMTSEFSNRARDRKYQVFFASSDRWTLTRCSDWIKLNKMDRPVNHILGPKQVIARLYSKHSNSKEDREFQVKQCDLIHKCDQLVKIEYGEIEQSASTDDVIGNNTYDNTDGASTNQFTAAISRTQQESHSDSYTFSRTSGWAHTGSIAVTAGVNWSVGVVGASVGVTAGFSTTYQTSEKWQRTQTKTYAEMNGNKVEFTANCKPGCKCSLIVTTTYGKAKVPYTMLTKTSGSTETCEEKGFLTYKRSWNAVGKSVDEC